MGGGVGVADRQINEYGLFQVGITAMMKIKTGIQGSREMEGGELLFCIG